MKKVLKVRYDGGKVVFDNLAEAMDFLNDLEINAYEAKMTEEDMSEEDYEKLK
jgi:hypothetical protein